MTYEERNRREKLKLDPAMQIKIEQLEDRLLLIGEDVLYTSGFRSIEEQNQKWRIGRDAKGKIVGTTVTNARGGDSFHNYGAALDFAPVALLLPLSARGPLAWYSIPRFANVALQAKEIGFEWGGDWEQRDYAHLQYTQGLTLADFKRGKTLSAKKARSERMKDLQKRLEIAKKALKSPAVTEKRKVQLQRFIPMLEQRLEDL